MKTLGFVAALLISATPAAYAEDCRSGGGIIEVRSWSATIEADNYAPLKITTVLANIGDRAFRMVDAGTRFTDALGRDIVSIKVDPDLTLAPMETATFEGYYLGGESERLAKLAPEDVTAVTCVRSVLYSDGQKVEF